METLGEFSFFKVGGAKWGIFVDQVGGGGQNGAFSNIFFWGGGAFAPNAPFGLPATGCTESTVVFPANQKAESAQEPVTVEFALVSFVSAMILRLKVKDAN